MHAKYIVLIIYFILAPSVAYAQDTTETTYTVTGYLDTVSDTPGIVQETLNMWRLSFELVIEEGGFTSLKIKRTYGVTFRSITSVENIYVDNNLIVVVNNENLFYVGKHGNGFYLKRCTLDQSECNSLEKMEL